MRLHVVRILAAAVVLTVAAALFADVFDMPSGQTSLEFVHVGNPGNAADSTTGSGAVAYMYQIGKYDVTAAQYVEFLNAVAKTDPYGLYYVSMSNSSDCSIQRTGSSGSYTYSVASGWANRPVNYISFGAAARFCNWLANGQSNAPASAEDGSYTLNGITDNASLLLVTRNADARYVLPTANEWYKAAYHKNDGVTGNYWLFPTQSNQSTVAEAPPGRAEPPGSANYASVLGSDHLTSVGAYASSPGPYGTFDQGGLLYQWTETIVASPPGYVPAYFGYAMFNSSFMSSSGDQLRSDYQVWPWSPVRQYNFMGFRVVRLYEHVAADFNRDGAINAADLEHFVACACGPAIRQADPACQDARLDGDEDVDQEDFAVFQRCWSGVLPADAACMNQEP